MLCDYGCCPKSEDVTEGSTVTSKRFAVKQGLSRYASLSFYSNAKGNRFRLWQKSTEEAGNAWLNCLK